MRLERSIDVATSLERAWELLADVESWPAWTASMREVRLLDGATALAPGVRARVRQPRLRPAVWTVTEVDAGRGFTWRSATMGVVTLGTHRLEPLPDGGVRLVLGLDQHGALAGLVGALTGSLTRRYVDLEAEGFRRRCESAAP